MMDCDLSANNFVRNFRVLLSSEVGLRSFTIEGLTFLGTRVMKEEFDCLKVDGAITEILT